MSILQFHFFNFLDIIVLFLILLLRLLLYHFIFHFRFQNILFFLNFIVSTKLLCLQISLLFLIASFFKESISLYRHLCISLYISFNIYKIIHWTGNVYSGLIIAHKWFHECSLSKLCHKNPLWYLEILTGGLSLHNQWSSSQRWTERKLKLKEVL